MKLLAAVAFCTMVDVLILWLLPTALIAAIALTCVLAMAWRLVKGVGRAEYMRGVGSVNL